MSHQYNYQDPYAAQGAEYLDDKGNPTSAPVNMPAHGYNNYDDLSPTEKTTPHDVDAGVAGTERVQPGRQGGHQPMSSFAAMGPPPRSTGILRMWRKDERGKQWTRGGGARSAGRMFCCCISITILLVVSIILTILMFIQPPNLVLDNINVDPNTAKLDLIRQEMSLDINLKINVTNPNWFTADFTRIAATISYPQTEGTFGGGERGSTPFAAHSVTSFPFTLTFNYSAKANGDTAMLTDIAKRCGLLGDKEQQITVGYDLKVWLRILSTTVSPHFSDQLSFDCPFKGSSIIKGLENGLNNLATELEQVD